MLATARTCHSLNHRRMRQSYDIDSLSFWLLRRLSDPVFPNNSAHPCQASTATHSRKYICLYKDPAAHAGGLVQLQDKIVVRFALTIYPYSLEA